MSILWRTLITSDLVDLAAAFFVLALAAAFLAGGSAFGASTEGVPGLVDTGEAIIYR